MGLIAQKWLEHARWAASGGNAQPWEAEINETEEHVEIRIYISPSYSKHPSAMDFGGEASVIALGCLCKYLQILASIDHYEMTSEYFQQNKGLWKSSVILHFTPNAKLQSAYSLDDLLKRKTDRRQYQPQSISETAMASIRKITKFYSQIKFLEFQENKKELRKPLMQIETIRWKNSQFIKSLLEEISFGKKETSQLDKIPASQLGISLPDIWLLRFFNFFPKLTFFFKLGFYYVASFKAISNYTNHSDRICFLRTQQYSFKDFFELGKCFQEIWLECARLGISFQPLGLPLIPLIYLNHKNQSIFSEKEALSLESITQTFEKHFDLNLKNPTMGFRIGLPRFPTEKSPRKPITFFKNPLLSTAFEQKKVTR